MYSTVAFCMIATVTVTGLLLCCLFSYRSQVTEGLLLPQKLSQKPPPKNDIFCKIFLPKLPFQLGVCHPTFPCYSRPICPHFHHQKQAFYAPQFHFILYIFSSSQHKPAHQHQYNFPIIYYINFCMLVL